MQTLTKAEEQIMQIIWKKERCLVREIIEELGDPDLPHSTISSVVRILEKKGFVGHKAYGKTHEYFPLIPREKYTKKGLRQLISDYFEGSPQQLVSFLVRENQLDLKELDRLTRMLEDAEKQSSEATKSSKTKKP